MGLFFKKSVNLCKGIKLNLSKSGIGISAGVKGFRIGRNANGKVYINAGRNGVYYRKQFGNKKAKNQELPVNNTPKETITITSNKLRKFDRLLYIPIIMAVGSVILFLFMPVLSIILFFFAALVFMYLTNKYKEDYANWETIHLKNKDKNIVFKKETDKNAIKHKRKLNLQKNAGYKNLTANIKVCNICGCIYDSNTCPTCNENKIKN